MEYFILDTVDNASLSLTKRKLTRKSFRPLCFLPLLKSSMANLKDEILKLTNPAPVFKDLEDNSDDGNVSRFKKYLLTKYK